MKQAAEYRQHARECLKLAQQARTDEERKQLMEMSAAWERMAVRREELLARDQGPEPEVDEASENDDRSRRRYDVV